MNGPPMPLGAIGVMKKFRRIGKSGSERSSARSRTSQDTFNSASKHGSSAFSHDTDLTRLSSIDDSSPLETLKEVLQDDLRELEIAGMVMPKLRPNPCFRPLEHRLAPREEIRSRPRRSSFSTDASKSPTKFTNQQDSVDALFFGRANVEPFSQAHHPRRIVLDQPETDDERKPMRRKRLRKQQSTGNLERRSLKYTVHSSTGYRTSNSAEHKHIATHDHQRQESGVSSTSKQIPRLTSVHGKRQSLHVAAVATALGDGDQAKTSNWIKYLQHYSKGEYNICNPPSPDMIDSNFDYLPAVFPHDEIKRMSIYRQYEVLWDKYGARSATPLAKEAAEFFNVESAMISFFDESRELCKVQWGLDSDGLFGRPLSVTAHALYSMEVMAVLNTKLDWRFKNNPWITKWPQARFIAVAPMMADDQVIGAFTILDSVPHAAFPYSDRRKLVEFADKAMAAMHKQHAWMTRTEELRSTPLLMRDSRIYGTYEPQSFASSRQPTPLSKGNMLSHMSSEPYLRLTEQTPPSSSEENREFGASSKYAKFHGTANQRVLPAIMTPDSQEFSASDHGAGSEHSTNTSFQDDWYQKKEFHEVLVEHFWGLKDRDVFEPSILEPENNRDDDYKDSKGLQRDLSFLNENSIQPLSIAKARSKKFEVLPEVNAHSERYRQEVDRAGYLSDKDDELEHLLQQHHDDASVTTSSSFRTHESLSDHRHPPCPGPPPSMPPPPPPESHRQSGTSSQSLARSNTKSSSSTQAVSVMSVPSSLYAPSHISHQTSETYAYSSSDYFADATAKCANIAQALNYDLVYLVDLKAIRTRRRDVDDLLLDRQLRTRVIARYPLGDSSSISVNADHHLEALRKTISIFHNNERGRSRTRGGEPSRGYELGVLISLGGPAPGTSKMRTDGVVLGAFKSVHAAPRRQHVGEMLQSGRQEDDDVRMLRDAVAQQGLEELLEREEERKTAMRAARRMRGRIVAGDGEN